MRSTAPTILRACFFRAFGSTCLLVLWSLQIPVASAANAESATDSALNPKLHALIKKLEEEPRGPFKQLRWFCNDGTIQPPKAYSCRERGGGRQHGQLREDVAKLREDGFAIANVLAAVDADELLRSPDDALQQLLIEKFLIAYDDGWIFRRARFYRGALQADDEMAGARRIVKALLTQPQWRDDRLLVVYDAARTLPWMEDLDNAGVEKVRADSVQLNDKDSGFSDLRNKIHNSPDAGDAQRVRDYAAKSGKPSLKTEYANLASEIDAVNDSERSTQQLSQIASQFKDDALATALRTVVNQVPPATAAPEFLQSAGAFAAEVRNELPRLSIDDRMLAVAAVTLVEQRVFVDLQQFQSTMATRSRQSLINVLFGLAQASYGTGLLSHREWQQFQQTHKSLVAKELPLGEYLAQLRVLERAPTWAQRRFIFDYQPALAKYEQLEPLSAQFIPNQIRSGPMLAYSQVLALLTEDATRQAGVEGELFGKAVGYGLQGLNPGVAEGVLLTLEQYAADIEPSIPKVLLVPETLADLPPVVGILTENAGNQLSHVQLLARNLGVPNVVVAPSLLPQIRAKTGQPVSLASSPGGIVKLSTLDEKEFRKRFQAATPDAGTQIVVDLNKLKLDTKQPIPGAELRSSDSGVSVGPKAAKLGELNFRYPGHVSSSLAIPFGSFRQVLDQKFKPNGNLSGFGWLKMRYTEQAKLDDSRARQQYRNDTLTQIRQWLMTVPLPAEFVSVLRQAMTKEFGQDGSYGVFVRSDTNVEDLPGFTGAGLNLTLPNVVGFENVLKAIRSVWASPFTERAFGWRQALMDHPEHLYVAVLLHQGVNNDKSGVLVSANIENGDQSAYTVVANEGVGGGVEGQSAEMLMVYPDQNRQEFLASATAPTKRVLLQNGGSELVRASNPDRLLTDSDIVALDKLVKDLHTWFKRDGKTLIADVEYGFDDEKLMLFQIRPFVENAAAQNNSVLQELDKPLNDALNVTVDLSKPVRLQRN